MLKDRATKDLNESLTRIVQGNISKQGNAKKVRKRDEKEPSQHKTGKRQKKGK